jgi:hypothetical protein
MRLAKHLLIIALIVPTVANAQCAAAGTRSAQNVAAVIGALSRSNSTHVQLVAFADPRLAPVKVVRGGAGARARAMLMAKTARIGIRDNGSVEIIRFASVGEPPVTVLRGFPSTTNGTEPNAVQANSLVGLFDAPEGDDLDRLAFAIDGAESSHGADPAMWRPDPDGPQGPMQVSLAAAIDSGGGDRFDLGANRQLGRAYLALLHRRYHDWPDAVAAYNWGPGNMDAWIAGGRPALRLPLEVARYRDRVLRAGVMPASPGSGATDEGAAR